MSPSTSSPTSLEQTPTTHRPGATVTAECTNLDGRVAPARRSGFTFRVIRRLLLLEAFWPSRRIMQFDEFCRLAA